MLPTELLVGVKHGREVDTEIDLGFFEEAGGKGASEERGLILSLHGCFQK